MSNSWDHLPNEAHINKLLSQCSNDQFLVSLYQQPGLDPSELYEIHMKIESGQGFDIIQDIVNEIVWHRLPDFIGTFAKHESRSKFRLVENRLWAAAIALVMYDCDYLFTCDSERIQVLAALGDVNAKLLLPVILSQREIKETV